MRYFTIFFITIILFSCHETNMILEKWDTYKIKKGKNSSGFHVMQFTDNRLQFQAIFNNSAIYSTVDSNNQADINKLFGFSEELDGHHENSARYGWNWDNNKLNIYAYCYANGVVENKFICSIKTDSSYNYEIFKTNTNYIFVFNGNQIIMDRGDNLGVGYLLFPYFGGTEKAPHDITIKIKTKL
jgi:hypothetical protein